MSNRQGEEASEDQRRFWLCVVPLDRDGTLTNSRPNGSKSWPAASQGLAGNWRQGARALTMQLRTADAGGFDLEHIDEIRYGIRADI